MNIFEDVEGLEITKPIPYIEPIEPIESIDSERNIRLYMIKNNENYYNSREKLRCLKYGGDVPDGYGSWGDYWKCR